MTGNQQDLEEYPHIMNIESKKAIWVWYMELHFAHLLRIRKWISGNKFALWASVDSYPLWYSFLHCSVWTNIKLSEGKHSSSSYSGSSRYVSLIKFRVSLEGFAWTIFHRIQKNEENHKYLKFDFHFLIHFSEMSWIYEIHVITSLSKHHWSLIK